MTTYIFQSKTYLDIPIKWFWGCIWPCNVFYSSSTLKQVDLSIAWSLKIFLHLKWTSDQEGCVAKFEKKLSRNIYFIWAPDFLTGLAGLPRYSLASAKYSSFPPNPPLNQSLSCAMAKRIGYNIYIHTWIDFLWMTSINSKIEITVFVNEEGSEMHLVTICHQIRW